jgi:uncharacterized protein YutE (UPF0331/DUF86 family)
VVDRDRVLARIDQLDGYLEELRSVVPARFEEYRAIEKRRACERLLQLCVEVVTDVSALLASGLRLGLPGDEEDLLAMLVDRGVLSTETAQRVRRMRGMRNILVHEYGRIDDALVYAAARDHLEDFAAVKQELLAFLRKL